MTLGQLIPDKNHRKFVWMTSETAYGYGRAIRDGVQKGVEVPGYLEVAAVHYVFSVRWGRVAKVPVVAILRLDSGCQLAVGCSDDPASDILTREDLTIRKDYGLHRERIEKETHGEA